MNKTRLAEKRYRDKLKKDKKEIRLNTKKQNKRIKKIKENYDDYNHQLQKTKKKTKLQKKKEYELSKRRKLIRIQNESNREKKQNERRQKRENIAEEDNDLGRFFEIATSDKIYVNKLNLHEIKDEILQDYTGDFELNGLMIIGPVEHKKNIRFKNMDDFERYINAIDIDYDSEDVTFTGYVYKINTPHFKIVKRNAYGRGTKYVQEIVEYHGRNCYIPTSGMCFIKYINYFTKKDYTQEFLTFIRKEQRRSNVMTSARVGSFCRKYNINIGCFDGTRINPRKITQRHTALKIHNNHFCLIWKSDNVSFNQVIENEIKPNFKVVDNVISDKHVKGFIKYEYNPKKSNLL